MGYFVYILSCSDDTYYTGYTNDIESRLLKHNTGKGAKYTASRRPVRLIYSETYPDKQSAMKREAEIKSWTRQEKQTLIEKN